MTSINEVVHGAATRREVRETLRGLGIEGAALEALCSLGAGHRHQLRSEQAAEAALTMASQYVSSHDEWEDVTTTATNGLAMAIIAADEVGIGGGSQFPTGAATSRIPALSGLGKGRKQASDGGAWSAAIESGRDQIAWKANLVGDFWRTSQEFSMDEQGNLLIDITSSCPDTGETEEVRIEAPESLIPAEWQFAISANALEQALQRGDEVEMAAWARVYNALAAKLDENRGSHQVW